MQRATRVGLGLLACAFLAFPATGYAETDEERKAIEEIERKAEEEKKKALERIKKKKEAAEKKKAEAEKKKEEARKKKEEAEAKKQAEREKKKAEEQRKKEEREAKKRGETLPPVDASPQPPPPPPQPTAETRPAPPVAPQAEPLPEAKPVDHAGDARWTGIGFVQKSSEAPTQEPASTGGVVVPPTLGALGMNRGHVLFGLGVARFNPINDGTTDDETAFNMLNPSFRFGWEFRNLGSLLAPWFDISWGLMFGSRTDNTTGSSNPYKFSVFALAAGGRFGMDLAPIDIFSGGPYVGYHFELFSAKLAPEDSLSATSESGTSSGLQYGLHARLRTRSKPGEPETLYVDGAYGWRKGEYQTTSHLELEAGLGVGAVYFVGWYQTRLGSSGRFEPSDVSDIGEATAASMPVDRRIGGGIAVTF